MADLRCLFLALRKIFFSNVYSIMSTNADNSYLIADKQIRFLADSFFMYLILFLVFDNQKTLHAFVCNIIYSQLIMQI